MGLQKLYKSCATLPLRNFFEVFDTKDLRYLIIVDNFGDLPDEYDDNELTTAWNNIIDEYTELSADTSYKNAINKESSILRDINMVNTCLASLRILKYGSIKAYEALKYFGYDLDKMTDEKDIEQLINTLKQKRTRIQIRQSSQKQVKDIKVDFYKEKAVIENLLGRQIDATRTTVKEWVAIVKIAKEQAKHGRANQERRRNK